MNKIKGLQLFFRNLFKRIFDRLYILDDIRENDQEVLLHISDTPDIIYPFLYKVIDRLRPEYIIHTGDLVDNIKLASGGSISSYKKSLEIFLNELSSRKTNIYIVSGNHDDTEYLKSVASENMHICPEGFVLKIEDIKIGLAHYKEKLPDEGNILLYGHEKTEIKAENKIYLNGLLYINIIELPHKDIHKLSYPMKTDSGRQFKRLKLP